MLTLATLIEGGHVSSWDPPGPALTMRLFYTTRFFDRDFNSLPEGNGYGFGSRKRPLHRAALEAVINRFTLGDRPAQLIRPRGQGMDPLFKRMRRPHRLVVEMRTHDTRTFGFFHAPNCFVAHVTVLADDVKGEAHGYARHAKAVEALMAYLRPDQIDGTDDVTILVT